MYECVYVCMYESMFMCMSECYKREKESGCEMEHSVRKDVGVTQRQKSEIVGLRERVHVRKKQLTFSLCACVCVCVWSDKDEPIACQTTSARAVS